ncbi:hypothetical protein SBV1_2560021 [Verrucomicrobia bacterium]|nr:hypothetical protein SBV1_2560021 [Verrucomicrobiota bacterium]
MKVIVTIDEVGRLVLPKAIRQAIGVSGRMAVSVATPMDCGGIAQRRHLFGLVRSAGAPFQPTAPDCLQFARTAGCC